jgi:FkbM family methyltransferase
MMMLMKGTLHFYMIANRSMKDFLIAAVQRQHYIALINMSKLYPKFSLNLWRYLTGRGHYPYDMEVRTPLGLISMRLYSHHDLLTANEIFCRQDYFADASVRHVIDVGSNIGISALYFLSRNGHSKCTLYEPDPRNIEKLKRNLRGFEDRYRLVQSAVSDHAGQVVFGIEATGRYGAIGLNTGESIIVTCMHINEVVRDALREASQIDILKIDTEGAEIQTVDAIEPELLQSISTIYLEAQPSRDLHPRMFRNKQYGSVHQLTKKRL